MPANSNIPLTIKLKENMDEGCSAWIHYQYPFDTIKKGWFRSTFETQTNNAYAYFEMHTGRFTLGKETCWIFDLAAFEAVDTYQWENRPPVNIEDQNGRIKERGRPTWTIASANTLRGDRIFGGYTNATRDEVFKLVTRLNALFDAAREIVTPWAEDARALYDKGIDSINELPADEIQAHKPMLDDMRQQWGELRSRVM